MQIRAQPTAHSPPLVLAWHSQKIRRSIVHDSCEGGLFLSLSFIFFFFYCWLQAMSKPFHCAFVFWYHPTKVWYLLCLKDMKVPLWIMFNINFLFAPKCVWNRGCSCKRVTRHTTGLHLKNTLCNRMHKCIITCTYTLMIGQGYFMRSRWFASCPSWNWLQTCRFQPRLCLTSLYLTNIVACSLFAKHTALLPVSLVHACSCCKTRLFYVSALIATLGTTREIAVFLGFVKADTMEAHLGLAYLVVQTSGLLQALVHLEFFIK